MVCKSSFVTITPCEVTSKGLEVTTENRFTYDQIMLNEPVPASLLK